MSTTPQPSILGPSLRGIGTACLVLGPIAFLIADLTSPAASGSPAQMLHALVGRTDATNTALIASLASALFLIAGLFLLLARPLRRGQALLATGVGLALYSFLANAVLLGVNVAFVAMADPSLNEGQMVKLMEDMMSNPIAPILLSGHQILVVAFLLFGLGLWRAGIGPTWAALFIAACGVVDAVGGMFGDAGDLWAGFASDALMIVGFAAMGWFLLREPRSVAAGADSRAAAAVVPD